MILCEICNKECKSTKSLLAHKWRAHTEEGKLHKLKTVSRGYTSHWKGQTKDTSDVIKHIAKKNSEIIQRKILNGTFIASKMGETARDKLSIEQSLHNRGGKCKWFDYKGQKLQGTWELNVAKKLDELNIEWIKPKVHKDVIQYELNGKNKHYTPDLYLPTYDLYLEIKGYWWGNDKAKMKAVMDQHPNIKIVLIEKNEYDKVMQGELVW